MPDGGKWTLFSQQVWNLGLVVWDTWMDLTEWPKSVKIFVSHLVPTIEEDLNSQVVKMTHHVSVSLFPPNGLFDVLLHKITILARLEVLHGLRNVDSPLLRLIWQLPQWLSAFSISETKMLRPWHGKTRGDLLSPSWRVQRLILTEVHWSSWQMCLVLMALLCGFIDGPIHCNGIPYSISFD